MSVYLFSALVLRDACG